jgi:acetyl-CoA C-acetyltransferase
VDGVRGLDPRRLPVIVGVGQLRNNRERTVDAAREPLELIVEAAERAIGDAAANVVGTIDGVDVVRVMTWDYDDLPGAVAAALGCRPRRAEHSDAGGNQPVALIDRAAARVAAGEERAVLVCGGEARASFTALERDGLEPPWTRSPGGPVRLPANRHASERAIRYGLNLPLRGYPLYENALRARLGQTVAESQRVSAAMLSEFAAVAATNPAAWAPIARTVHEIETVSPTNRMLCFPYTLLMVAQPMTDQAAAVIVTTLEHAREANVPEHRIVYVWGGAGAADNTDLLARVDYSHSPAMEATLTTTLDRAGLTGADLGAVDLYSCYPVVPKLAIEVLGLRDGTPRTTTGGLNAFGAPANNYSTHAVVSMVEAIRAGRQVGLVYGNGEVLTKHHAVVLADRPHADGYVGGGATVVTPASEVPPVVREAEGPAIVETYTVEYARDGSPSLGYVIGRTATGARFAAHVQDRSTLARLTDVEDEPIGGKGAVSPTADGLNQFTF